MDRRVRRSRRALQDALVALILERGYAAVTVEQITERADVSRATFYAHYTDKSDLLTSAVDDLWADLDSRVAPVMPVRKPEIAGAGIAALFRHAAEHVDLYRVILGGACDGKPYRVFARRVALRLEQVRRERARNLGLTPRLPYEFLARSFTAEILATLTWWLEDPEHRSASDVALMLLQRNVYGDSWAHGSDRVGLALDEDAVRAAMAGVQVR